MDASEIEINSFVVKLKQLWRSGFSAHLNLDCSDGKAWVGLRLQLGEAPAYPYDMKNFRTPGKHSPSKARRFKKRSEFIHTTPQEVDTNAVKEEVSSVSVINDVVKARRDHNMKEVLEECEAVSNNILNDDEIELGSVVPTEKVADMVKTEVNDHSDQVDATQEDDIALVHATVLFQNTNTCLMDRKYVDAVNQIIMSKDHLRQNIAEVKFGYAKSCKSINSSFTHDLPIILHVKTGSLWQSPRSYIWKHLGNSE